MCGVCMYECVCVHKHVCVFIGGGRGGLAWEYSQRFNGDFPFLKIHFDFTTVSTAIKFFGA